MWEHVPKHPKRRGGIDVSMTKEQCRCCGHTFSFHSRKPGERCKAVGCHKGPRGRSCQGFEPRKDASSELREALSAEA